MRFQLSIWLKTSIFFGFLLLAAPAISHATEYNVESKTYLSLSESVSGKELAPAYEYLDVSLLKIGGKDVSFYASGWLRQHLNDNLTGEDDFEQELSYAYINFRPTSQAFINLGRVLVYEGVASEQMDGLYLKSALPEGFELAAFGGVPVETDNDGRDGDYGYGARLSHRMEDYYSIGISYFYEDNDSDDLREESGLDIWISPIKKVHLEGVSSYNSHTNGWMENTYSLGLGPFENLRLNGEYSEIDYEHFFSSATLSAFDISSLDPEESIQIAGGSAELGFADSFTTGVEYKNYDYDLSGSADFYGALLRFSREGYAAGFSVHRMDGETDRLRYYQYRAYTTKRWEKADITLDIFDVNYDEKINEVENAYAIVAAMGYNHTSNIRAVVDFEYAENPFFDNEFKAFFKLLLKFAGGA